jgi:hypothetical protein
MVITGDVPMSANNREHMHPRRIPCHRLRRTTALFLLVTIGGCSDVTRVSQPGVVSSANFNNPTGANILRNQAVVAFHYAYALQVFASGLITDEFTATPSNESLTLPDSRHISATVQIYPYNVLSSTRVDALTALPVLEQYSPDSTLQIAGLFAALGFTEVMLSEDMCSGVPTAIVSSGVATYGPNLTSAQLLALGLSHFDSSLAHAARNDSLTNLDVIGKARALLDSGDFADAATVVASVPVTYSYPLQFDTIQSAVNPIYSAINLGTSGGATVSDREGENGIDFISGQDPRSATDSLGEGIWGVHSYGYSSAPIPLATGIEAQLIVAEADLHAGNVTAWVSILNGLRNTAITPSLPNLPPDSTTTASAALRLEVMFRERALWLFATGHRQGDLRRLVRQYGLLVDAVFPTGPYHGGPQTYGEDVTYVPYNENFNPGYTGCSNRLP